MSQENPIITETKRRLEHLRTMPITDLRRREILSLERVLEIVPRQAKAAKAPRARRNQAAGRDDSDSDEEAVSSAPVRRVVQVDGRQRVILRAPRKEETISDSQLAMEERARKETTATIQSLVGLTHRGMS